MTMPMSPVNMPPQPLAAPLPNQAQQLPAPLAETTTPLPAPGMGPMPQLPKQPEGDSVQFGACSKTLAAAPGVRFQGPSKTAKKPLMSRLAAMLGQK